MEISGNKTARLFAMTAARESRPAEAFHWMVFMLAATLLFVIAPRIMAAQQTEDIEATVQYLITYIEQSDVSFQRNTTRYTGSEAAQHINRKYQHFKDDIDTPEVFIELCATGSLMTGRPYLVITTQGEQRLASEWLNAELEIYRLRNEHPRP